MSITNMFFEIFAALPVLSVVHENQGSNVPKLIWDINKPDPTVKKSHILSKLCVTKDMVVDPQNGELARDAIVDDFPRDTTVDDGIYDKSATSLPTSGSNIMSQWMSDEKYSRMDYKLANNADFMKNSSKTTNGIASTSPFNCFPCLTNQAVSAILCGTFSHKLPAFLSNQDNAKVAAATIKKIKETLIHGITGFINFWHRMRICDENEANQKPPHPFSLPSVHPKIPGVASFVQMKHLIQLNKYSKRNVGTQTDGVQGLDVSNEPVPARRLFWNYRPKIFQFGRSPVIPDYLPSERLEIFQFGRRYSEDEDELSVRSPSESSTASRNEEFTYDTENEPPTPEGPSPHSSMEDLTLIPSTPQPRKILKARRKL